MRLAPCIPPFPSWTLELLPDSYRTSLEGSQKIIGSSEGAIKHICRRIVGNWRVFSISYLQSAHINYFIKKNVYRASVRGIITPRTKCGAQNTTTKKKRRKKLANIQQQNRARTCIKNGPKSVRVCRTIVFIVSSVITIGWQMRVAAPKQQIIIYIIYSTGKIHEFDMTIRAIKYLWHIMM